MSSCSVVMVSYHTGPVLFAAIKGALSQAQLAEVILIDNGNPPDVSMRLERLALTETKLELVVGQGNVGFARGCNLGAGRAGGEFLLLLNPDCLLPPGALSQFMAALGEVPGAMLAGGWLLNPDGSEQRGGRRQPLTVGTALGEVLRLPGLRRHNDHETRMPDGTHEVPVISGACMCIRRADYSRLSGLDEGFFLHVEDLDFCMRVHQIGGKVICVPRVQVAHMLSTSGQTSPTFIEWQKARGFMRYFDKHLRGRSVPGLVLLVRLGILARYVLRVLRGRLRRGRPPSVAAKRLMLLASGLAELPESGDFDGKTVLVTDATSQVGLCVVSRLIAAHAAVLGLRRGEAIPFRHPNLRWIEGDLSDPALRLGEYSIGSVVHCAPLQHLPPAVDRLAAARVGRVVAIGPSGIFGDVRSADGAEKEEVERAEAEIADRCRACKVRWTVLRPTWVYGVGLDGNVSELARLIRRLGWFPVYPPARGRLQPVHADDLALAVLQALPCEASFDKSYHIGGGETVTYREMLTRIFRLYGKRPQIIEMPLLPLALDLAATVLRKRHISGEMARRMNDDLILSDDAASRDFGFAPRAFLRDGLMDIDPYSGSCHH